MIWSEKGRHERFSCCTVEAFYNFLSFSIFLVHVSPSAASIAILTPLPHPFSQLRRVIRFT